ncbi:MAG: asparaginase [Trueperaceae bacterium]
MTSYTFTYRGEYIENRHAISIAIVNAEQKLIAHSGDPQLITYLRSSAKPFQVQALFQTDAAAHYHFTEQEIALACASHSGTPDHVRVAKGILEKLKLKPSDLACGVHPPMSKEERQRLAGAGETSTVLHNNCSGKHAGMLAVALRLNAPTQGYEHLEHPVQQLNLQTLRDLSGMQDIPIAIDGCSVPVFALPLDKAAWLFAQLTQPQAAPKKYQEGLEAAFRAMHTFPEMVAGVGEMDTVLMQHVPGLVAKQGADGYYGMTLRETKFGPLGIVLKVEDGSTAAREPAVIALLEELGVLAKDNTLPWKRPVICNHRKIETGYLEAAISLVWS